MTKRESAPPGVPCWADLWTSDVEGSREFYGRLFGWEAQEPSAEFGGYFMFNRHGVPVAGGMVSAAARAATCSTERAAAWPTSLSCSPTPGSGVNSM